MNDDFLFVTDDLLAEFEEEEKAKGNSKRDKIISAIFNFDFDKYKSKSEWVNLFIDDFDYPVFKKKKNSVEVQLVYTSCFDWILEDKYFTLEVFVYGRTIITCKGKAPELAFIIANAISDSYLEAIRPVIKNRKEIKQIKTRRFKKGIIYAPERVAAV